MILATRNRKEIPLKTRKKVLQRCFFTCTYPGCTNIACDLHHVDLHYKGGSDKDDNLIGLCKSCHRKLHRGVYNYENSKLLIEEQKARFASLIEECPVRFNPELQSTLFQQILDATQSVISMEYAISDFYNPALWRTYDIFLKGCIRLYKDQKKYVKVELISNEVLLVVLLNIVCLYRRRGKKSLLATSAKVKWFDNLYDSQTREVRKRLKGVRARMEYEKAYIAYLQYPNSQSSYNLFRKATSLYTEIGNYGQYFWVKSVSLMVLRNQGQDIDDKLSSLNADLDQISDSKMVRRISSNIALIKSRNAISQRKWKKIPNYISLSTETEDVYAYMSKSPDPITVYLEGISAFFNDSVDLSLKLLNMAVSASYTHCLTESRSDFFATLADMYLYTGEVKLAMENYQKALKQTYIMNNQKAHKHCEEMLRELKKDWRIKIKAIYLP